MEMREIISKSSLAVLVSALALTACGSSATSITSKTNTAAPAAVKWIDKPATIPTTTVVATPIPPTCKPADLQVRSVSFGFATAQEGWRVPITNTGNGACSLPDHLSNVTAIGSDGNRVALSNSPLLQPAPPVTFPRKGQMTFQILSEAWCDSVGLVLPSKQFSSVELALPTGILDLSNLTLKLCNNQIFSGFQ